MKIKSSRDPPVYFPICEYVNEKSRCKVSDFLELMKIYQKSKFFKLLEKSKLYKEISIRKTQLMFKHFGVPGSESEYGMKMLEWGICIETDNKLHRRWNYYKFLNLAENTVSYEMHIFTKESIITCSCSEEEFPLYFIKPRELRRKKLERLKALSNRKVLTKSC